MPNRRPIRPQVRQQARHIGFSNAARPKPASGGQNYAVYRTDSQADLKSARDAAHFAWLRECLARIRYRGIQRNCDELDRLIVCSRYLVLVFGFIGGFSAAMLLSGLGSIPYGEIFIRMLLFLCCNGSCCRSLLSGIGRLFGIRVSIVQSLNLIGLTKVYVAIAWIVACILFYLYNRWPSPFCWEAP